MVGKRWTAKTSEMLDVQTLRILQQAPVCPGCNNRLWTGRLVDESSPMHVHSVWVGCCQVCGRQLFTKEQMAAFRVVCKINMAQAYLMMFLILE